MERIKQELTITFIQDCKKYKVKGYRDFDGYIKAGNPTISRYDYIVILDSKKKKHYVIDKCRILSVK